MVGGEQALAHRFFRSLVAEKLVRRTADEGEVVLADVLRVLLIKVETTAVDEVLETI